jgi:hypothetical protein
MRRFDHFVPRVAYSTGLILGRFLVDIVADLLGDYSRRGSRMSTAGIAVREMLERRREDDQPEAVLPRITLAKDYPHPGRELSESDAGLWAALQEIVAPTAKAEIQAVLDRLPDESSLDDILHQLDEREHLRRGVASAIYEPLVSQGQMEVWFEQRAQEESPAVAAKPQVPIEELPTSSPQEESASYEVSLTKDEILQALDDLPDHCTMEDILHTLHVREQIKQGMWSLDNEPTFTQEEVEQSLSRWLTR